MSTVQGSAAGVSAPSVSVGVVGIVGRVAVKSRAIQTQEGRRFMTVIALAAADEYSMPGKVEVRSVESLGNVGDDVRLKVRVSGYPNNFEVKDRDTGEVRTVYSARNTLDVLA